MKTQSERLCAARDRNTQRRAVMAVTADILRGDLNSVPPSSCAACVRSGVDPPWVHWEHLSRAKYG